MSASARIQTRKFSKKDPSPVFKLLGVNVSKSERLSPEIFEKDPPPPTPRIFQFFGGQRLQVRAVKTRNCREGSSPPFSNFWGSTSPSPRGQAQKFSKRILPSVFPKFLGANVSKSERLSPEIFEKDPPPRFRISGDQRLQVRAVTPRNFREGSSPLFSNFCGSTSRSSAKPVTTSCCSMIFRETFCNQLLPRNLLQPAVLSRSSKPFATSCFRETFCNQLFT